MKKPEINTRERDNTRVAFIQFQTENEGKMAQKLINLMECENIQANFAIKSSGSRIANSDLKYESENKHISEIEIHMQLRKCQFCGELESEFVCNDCTSLHTATFYCSEDHQSRDWSRHKMECKALPKLKRAVDHFPKAAIHNRESNYNIDDDTNDRAESPYDDIENRKMKKKYVTSSIECPKNGDKVLITSISENRKVIYIRPINSSYEPLLERVEQHGKKAPFLTSEPEIGDTVLAPFINVSAYGRARVQDMFQNDSDGHNIKVFFIDFGHEIKCRWSMLKTLGFKMRAEACHIFKTVLDGTRTESYNSQIGDYLLELFDKNEELEIISIFNKGIGYYKVILRELSTNSIVNERINEMMICKSALIQSENLDEPIFYNVRIIIKIAFSNTNYIFKKKLKFSRVN